MNGFSPGGGGQEHLVRTSGAAIVSLLFGLAAWTVLPFIGALVAVICGHMARSTIRRSGGLVDGDAMALVGLILGWLQLILFGLGLLALLGLFSHVLGGGSGWLHPSQPTLPPGGTFV